MCVHTTVPYCQICAIGLVPLGAIGDLGIVLVTVAAAIPHVHGVCTCVSFQTAGSELCFHYTVKF